MPPIQEHQDDADVILNRVQLQDKTVDELKEMAIDKGLKQCQRNAYSKYTC